MWVAAAILALIGLAIGIFGLVLSLSQSAQALFMRGVSGLSEARFRWLVSNPWSLSTEALRLYGLGLFFTGPILSLLLGGAFSRAHGLPDFSFVVWLMLLAELAVIAMSAVSFSRYQVTTRRLIVAPGLSLIATVVEAVCAIGGIILWLAVMPLHG